MTKREIKTAVLVVALSIVRVIVLMIAFVLIMIWIIFDLTARTHFFDEWESNWTANVAGAERWGGLDYQEEPHYSFTTLSYERMLAVKDERVYFTYKIIDPVTDESRYGLASVDFTENNVEKYGSVKAKSLYHQSLHDKELYFDEECSYYIDGKLVLLGKEEVLEHDIRTGHTEIYSREEYTIPVTPYYVSLGDNEGAITITNRETEASKIIDIAEAAEKNEYLKLLLEREDVNPQHPFLEAFVYDDQIYLTAGISNSHGWQFAAAFQCEPDTGEITYLWHTPGIEHADGYDLIPIVE